MFKKAIFAVAFGAAGLAAQAGVVSGFGSGNEGWGGLTADPSQSGAPIFLASLPLDWSAAGGNPGGRIGLLDGDSADTMFAAPGAFLGDQSSTLGTTLSYDLFTDFVANYNGPNVVLKGNGLTLVHVPAAQAAVADQWVHISVPLSDDGLWHLDRAGGSLAGANDLKSALGALSALWISGETHNGVEETSLLDNVQLGRLGNDVPEPGSLLLVAAAAALLTRRRRRRGS